MLTTPQVAPLEEDLLSDDRLTIAGLTFRSRLWIGTGKYRSFEETRKVILESGADVVTVAVRRVNILKKDEPNLLDYLPTSEFHILPNTAGCYTVDEALRYARLAREAGISPLVKLEVIGDAKTLFPDVVGLVEAARILVKEGSIVFPYTNDDPVIARKLVDVGCVAVMPLAAPIGSGLGIRNPWNLRIIQETVSVPVIVDAGVGCASDATIAMEMGVDGVLMNTAVAEASNPVLMARAMKLGILAGRASFRAGRMPRKLYANASSPLSGMLDP